MIWRFEKVARCLLLCNPIIIELSGVLFFFGGTRGGGRSSHLPVLSTENTTGRMGRRWGRSSKLIGGVIEMNNDGHNRGPRELVIVRCRSLGIPCA